MESKGGRGAKLPKENPTGVGMRGEEEENKIKRESPLGCSTKGLAGGANGVGNSGLLGHPIPPPVAKHAAPFPSMAARTLSLHDTAHGAP